MRNVWVLIMTCVMAWGCKGHKAPVEEEETAAPSMETEVSGKEAAKPAPEGGGDEKAEGAVEEPAEKKEAEAVGEGEGPPPLKSPKSFGVDACDAYAGLACGCRDTLRRKMMCDEAHKLFTQWRKIASRKSMRSFVEQGCKQSLSGLESACK